MYVSLPSVPLPPKTTGCVKTRSIQDLVRITICPDELCSLVQQPAKDARKPFEQGEHTQGSGARYFGVKVFVVLALRFQAETTQGNDDPNIKEGALAVRVSKTGRLSTICGPYATLLQQVLAQITEATTKTNLTQVGPYCHAMEYCYARGCSI